jgi:plastocyanin
VLVVSCGGGKADGYGESKARAVAGSAVAIEMKNLKFEPQGIKVKPGTKVTWINKDGAVHNVRQVESAFLSPDQMQPGEDFSFTFEQPGTYRYQCTFHHPTMNGIVIVEEQ